MKKIILPLLILFTHFSYSQSVFDLEQKIKKYAEEVTDLRSRNNNLTLDSIQNVLKIHQIKRDTDYKIKKLEYDVIYLKWQQKKYLLQIDTLSKFKLEVYDASKNGSIIYLLKNDPSTIFYIDLSKYTIASLNNDLIKLVPITDPSKWRKFQIDGFPSPDNLSLHLYPHDIYGDKFKY